MDGAKLKGYDLGVRLKSSSASERNHHGGWVGIMPSRDATGMMVTDQGRWVMDGNWQGRTPKLVGGRGDGCPGGVVSSESRRQPLRAP